MFLSTCSNLNMISFENDVRHIWVFKIFPLVIVKLQVETPASSPVVIICTIKFTYLLTFLITYLLTYLLYLLTAWIRVLLEKLPFSQLVKNFPAFYGNRRVITEW